MPASATMETWSVLLLSALALLGVWVTARIVGRAGFRPWWALLILVPVVNLAMIYVFAFVRWPISENPAPAGKGQAGPINRKKQPGKAPPQTRKGLAVWRQSP